MLKSETVRSQYAGGEELSSSDRSPERCENPSVRVVVIRRKFARLMECSALEFAGPRDRRPESTSTMLREDAAANCRLARRALQAERWGLTVRERGTSW